MPAHTHGPGCGHPAIRHGDHVDYLQDGALQRPTRGGVDEHDLGVDAETPDTCTHGRGCAGHDADHTHGPGCGHPSIRHGDHVDYLVGGQLHHPHGGHCDPHGSVKLEH